jgi:hypothetical protein
MASLFAEDKSKAAKLAGKWKFFQGGGDEDFQDNTEYEFTLHRNGQVSVKDNNFDIKGWSCSDDGQVINIIWYHYFKNGRRYQHADENVALEL